MIPSRGLQRSSQIIGLGRRRLQTSPARLFSSNRSLRTSPILSQSNAFSTNTIRPTLTQTNHIFKNGTVRFQSTAPATPVTPAEIATTPIETTLDNNITSGVLDIPERIGYLKEMGLDFGWGPTAVMEWLLEHIHVLSGTPWWASIGLTAIAVRLILLKPYMDAADVGARMASIKHITAPITQQMQEASRVGNTAETFAKRAELQLVHKRAGIKLWKSFVPMLQVFIGFGTFRLLRAMSNLPVPGLETGGIAWFPDLTVPDPYLALPLATAGILHYVLRRGGETGVTLMSAKAVRVMSYALPAITVVFTYFLPSGLQLSFLISGILSFFQSSAFKNKSFREWAGMMPLPSPAPLSTTTGGSGNTIKLAPSQYRDTTTLSYQAPKPTSTIKTQNSILGGAKASILDGLKDAKDLAESAKKSVDEKMGTAKVDGKRSKLDLKNAEAYEKKRSAEIERKRFEDEQRRMAERRMKKMARR